MRALPLLVLCACPLLAAPAFASPVFTGFHPQDGPAALFPETACGRTAGQPSVQARRVPSGALRLDGRLDEGHWSEAQGGWGFSQWDPERGDPASQETVFEVCVAQPA